MQDVNDALVENEGSGDSNVHDSEHLGTNVVGSNLDGVRDQKRSVCDSVEAVEHKDCSHDEVSRVLVRGVVRVDTSAGRPENIGEEHAGVGSEEELAATDLLDKERGSGGNDD